MLHVKIVLDTLGCKLNQAETESMAIDFVHLGWEVISDLRLADAYLLNTCSVTAESDSKARHLIGNAHRRNPRIHIVVTGCYAQRDQARINMLTGVELVIPNGGKTSLAATLTRNLMSNAVRTTKQHANPGRTRSFIKIQDGCNGACAYCIVPKVRNHPRSVPANDVIASVQERVAHGFKEIVVTGTEIGAYSDGDTNLEALLDIVLRETDACRVRISSLQPQEITPSLLSLWKNTRLCPHFHVALQSGSDRVLRAMRRRYSVESYAKALARIRAEIQGVAVTTDVIVGFPGETEEDFAETMSVCRELGFARIHVFPFSARPETEAASLPNHVNERIKGQRKKAMLDLAQQSVEGFRASLRGVTRPVLWENRDSNGAWTGLTDNYISVRLVSSTNLHNQVTPFVVE